MTKLLNIDPPELPTHHTPRGIAFAMRYPDDVGFVWNSMARVYDLCAKQLINRVNCFLAFPKLTGSPAYQPHTLSSITADFYNTAPAARAQLAKTILNKRISAIVYMGCDPATVDLRWLRRQGLQTISYEQDSFPAHRRQTLFKRSLKQILRRGLQWNLHDLYIANAHHQRRFLLDFAKLPSQRVTTIANGVDCEIFIPGPSPDPATYGLPVTAHYAVSICQAREEKRIDQLIEIAAILFAKKPDLSLTFVHVGDGPALSGWRSLAARSGLGQRFQFLGFHNDVAPFHRLASFFVHTAERESFGLVIAEAMASGKPVIAMDSPGPREIILNDQTGWVVPCGDLNSFAEYVLRLASNDDQRSALGDRARTRALSEFDVRRQAEELARAISSVAESKC